MMSKQKTLERALRVLPSYVNSAFGDKQDKITVFEIIELLKAQEPVAPSVCNGTSYCGNCGDQLNKLDNYCHECGRAVKWE